VKANPTKPETEVVRIFGLLIGILGIFFGLKKRGRFGYIMRRSGNGIRKWMGGRNILNQ
jgi:hypothetical protein